jgi:hypothetical protein
MLLRKVREETETCFVQIAISKFAQKNSKIEKNGSGHEYMKKNSFRTPSTYPRLLEQTQNEDEVLDMDDLLKTSNYIFLEGKLFNSPFVDGLYYKSSYSK